jgi:hypothetical protein
VVVGGGGGGLDVVVVVGGAGGGTVLAAMRRAARPVLASEMLAVDEGAGAACGEVAAGTTVACVSATTAATMRTIETGAARPRRL